ncbi:MAG: GNAT family N-acetyltransferase [Clostridia bacterium]|nr:GNAT family N-acetyltransferase [Clostridia bacterium]MBQ7139526.1 GNAT family N-acetyltransferase [Clostridia bacterium]
MNVTIRKPKSPLDWLSVRLLYHRAFPASERKPFSMIRRMTRAGRTDLWIAEVEGHFAGLAATINGPEMILLDYLAVHEKHRDQGVGGAFLKGLLNLYEGKGLFVEIEDPSRDDESGIKARRKGFYLRNGLTDMGVTVMLFGVRMILMGRGCSLDFDGYRTFYRTNYNEWAAQHITPPEEN